MLCCLWRQRRVSHCGIWRRAPVETCLPADLYACSLVPQLEQLDQTLPLQGAPGRSRTLTGSTQHLPNEGHVGKPPHSPGVCVCATPQTRALWGSPCRIRTDNMLVSPLSSVRLLPNKHLWMTFDGYACYPQCFGGSWHRKGVSHIWLTCERLS